MRIERRLSLGLKRTKKMKYSDVLNKKAADLGATIEGGSYDDYYKQYMESDSVKRRKRLVAAFSDSIGAAMK